MLVVVLILVAAACGSDSDAAIPIESLVGHWDQPHDDHLNGVVILDDDTYTFYVDDLNGGDLPIDFGTYRFDGDMIEFHNEGGRGCEGDAGTRVGSDGSYTATFDGPNKATLNVVEDECPRRANALDEMSLVRSDG